MKSERARSSSKLTPSTPSAGEHVLRHVRIVRDDLEPERLGLGGDRARDVAEADEAEHLPFEPAQRHDGGISQRPDCTSVFEQRHLAGERQQQRHGVVGHLAQAIVGHIGDRDAELGGGRQVDIVDAEPEAADHLAARELAQQLAGELGIGDQHRVGVARHREDVVGDCRSSPCARPDRARLSAAMAGSSDGNGLSVTAITGRLMASTSGLTQFGGGRPSRIARMLSTTMFAISLAHLDDGAAEMRA